jgi:hypothetical protein
MKTFTLILAILFCTKIFSQDTHLLGTFPTIEHVGKLSSKLEYGLYYFGAFPLINLSKSKQLSNTSLLLFYAENGLTYHLNKRLSVNAAYVFQKENPIDENFVLENRIHTQIQYKFLARKTEIRQRIRFDYRYLKPNNQKDYSIKHRIRYLAGFTLPINQNAGSYITTYEEVFFNTNPIYKVGLEENWFALNWGKKISNKHKFETGPLYISWKTGQKTWLHQYYWQFTWISLIDYTVKKNPILKN